MPRVSVVIPTYNDAIFLPVTIESVLKQTYQDFELFVVDDGSTDNTREVVAPYLARLHYIYQKNQGESVARNQAIQRAQGEYIAFLDSDDFWLPDKLERQLAVLDAHPQAVLLYGDSYVCDAAGNQIGYMGNGSAGDPLAPRDMTHALLLDDVIASISSVIVRKAALDQTELFDSTIQWGEDWDLWIRLSLVGPFICHPVPLTTTRVRRPGRRLQIEASDDFIHQNEQFLHKFFGRLPQRWDALRQYEPDAFVALYTRSALHNFVLKDTGRGATYLAKAAQADERILTSRADQTARLIAYEGFSLTKGPQDLAVALDFVATVFDHLPAEAASLRNRRALALAEVYAAAAFRAYETHDGPATWRSVLRAIRCYPLMALNRGLLTIGAKSLIGRGGTGLPGLAHAGESRS